MTNLSIISALPETGDLLLLVISGLLTVIAVYSKRHIDRIDSMMKANTEQHSNIEKKLSSVDTWTKAVHEAEIIPVVKRSEKNERDIVGIKFVQNEHGESIKEIKKKIAL